MGFLSNYTTKNWTQVTNLGKPVMIGFSFSKSPTSSTSVTVSITNTTANATSVNATSPNATSTANNTGTAAINFTEA